MRYTLLTKHSTKAERIFYEILKRNHIPFRFRAQIAGREIDFLLGRIAIEIDGHPQSGKKNSELISQGYLVLHITNGYLRSSPASVEGQLLHIWHNLKEQTSEHQS